jgi:plastocyanin
MTCFADPCLLTCAFQNHTVTQSSFADPCGPAAGGADSGFQFVAANSTDAPPTYSVQVKDKKPMWFFCRQANATPNFHCGKGMVMSVNCPLDPTAQNSFENFKKSALAVGDRLAKEAAAASGADTAYGQPSASPSASKSWEGYYAGTSVYTAPYGDATLPPPPATIATVTQTVEAQGKTWTTTYASYPGSPDPTPNAEPKVFQVTVGADKKLKFNPERVDAKVGDIISFTFMGGNHTVTQSSFADPCRRLKDPKTNEVTGWTSDFQFVGTSTDFKTVNITVKDTAPAWYYCAQKATASHCGAGMTFAVNSDEKGPRNNAAFQALAQKLNGTAVCFTLYIRMLARI